jgi:hypothetical protein
MRDTSRSHVNSIARLGVKVESRDRVSREFTAPETFYKLIQRTANRAAVCLRPFGFRVTEISRSTGAPSFPPWRVVDPPPTPSPPRPLPRPANAVHGAARKALIKIGGWSGRCADGTAATTATAGRRNLTARLRRLDARYWNRDLFTCGRLGASEMDGGRAPGAREAGQEKENRRRAPRGE